MKTNFKKGRFEETIIFIHGNSSNATVFSSLLNSPKFEYSSLTIELPGHYDDFQDQGFKEFSIPNIINNLVEIIGAIENSIFLYGHSLGGHLAIEIAPQLHNLKGICIMGTPPIELPLNFESAFNPVPEMVVLFEEQPEDGILEAFLDKAVTNPTVKDHIKADFLNTQPKVRTGVANAAPNNQWNNQRAIFKSLQISKYIAHGFKDPFINLSYLEEINAENQPECELTLFNHSGHYPMLEVPNDYEAYIIEITNKVFGL